VRASARAKTQFGFGWFSLDRNSMPPTHTETTKWVGWIEILFPSFLKSVCRVQISLFYVFFLGFFQFPRFGLVLGGFMVDLRLF